MLTFVSIVRFLSIAKWTTTERFLSLALFSLLVNTVILYIFLQHNFSLLTYFYRWGTFSIFIFIPACFHYIKYSMSKGKLRTADLLLYLPALVYLIDYLPFFFSGYHSKYDAMMYDFNNDIAHQHIQSHIMPFGSYFFIQNALGLVLSLYLFYLIPNYVRIGGKTYFQENRSLIFWNIALSFFILLTCMPDLLFSVTGKRFDFKSFSYISPCLFLYTLFPLSVLLSPNSYRYSKGFWTNKLNSLKPAHLFTIGNLYPYQGVDDILSHSQTLLNGRKTAYQAQRGSFSQLEYIDSVKAEKLLKSVESAIVKSELYNREYITLPELASASGQPEIQINSLLNDHLHTDLHSFVKSYKPDSGA